MAETTENKPKENISEKVVSLCVRRGILFPNSEIYGKMAGFFDFGPYGAEIKRNLENSWWKFFVSEREDIVGMDGAIISHPLVWKASGHVDAFNDPLVECTKCKNRFRADHLIESELKISVDGISLEKAEELIHLNKIKCPECNGALGVCRPFNLMFKTNVGAVESEANVAYLRPETAQLIFTDFKQIQMSSRKKLPFGIAQAGKAFRNEISPRNFVFRCREFSQMEIEFFIHPKKMNECPFLNDEVRNFSANFLTEKMQEEKKEHEVMTIGSVLDAGIIKTAWHAYFIKTAIEWLVSIGIRKEKLRIRQHVKNELSHYSSETWDVEYEYPWGWKELEGIANRTDFDLKQHMAISKKDLGYFDEETKEKVIPYVIEPSIGVERTIFTALIDAYSEKEEKGEKKTVLKLHPSISPVKVSIFPLMKKDGLAEKAHEIFHLLKKKFVCEYDDSGSIGKRYARSDEIGTPFALTVDYDTLEKQTVTIRSRDTAEQKRIKISDIAETVSSLISGEKSFGGI